MQILGLLGMYFIDDVVVCVCHHFFTFIQIASGHTVMYYNPPCMGIYYVQRTCKYLPQK